jgi:hypothetical protein
MPRRPNSLIPGIATLLLTFGQLSFAEPYAPRVGQRHTDFTLPAISDGRPVSLSDYRGKKLLLIHFASW